MRDKNIIKALECCEREYDKNCKECHYSKYSRTGCSGEMRKDDACGKMVNFIEKE